MKDTIILKFEVESNLSDTQRSMVISKQVSDYMQKFPDAKLLHFSVEYVWNREQRVKQTEEFLRAHPGYEKQDVEYRKKADKVDKTLKEEFDAHIDNPNR